MVCAPVRRDNPRALAMLYLTCTTITSVDLAHRGVSRAKDWVSVDCGTRRVCGQCAMNQISLNYIIKLYI